MAVTSRDRHAWTQVLVNLLSVRGSFLLLLLFLSLRQLCLCLRRRRPMSDCVARLGLLYPWTGKLTAPSLASSDAARILSSDGKCGAIGREITVCKEHWRAHTGLVDLRSLLAT